MATSFSTLLDDLGTAEAAKLLGLDESHVRVMKARDSIAPEHWDKLIEARPALTYADFVKWRRQRFTPLPIAASEPEGAAA